MRPTALLALLLIAAVFLVGNVSPSSADDLHNEALSLARSGRLKDAAGLFRDAIRMSGSDMVGSSLLVNYGVTLMRLGKLKKARKQLRRALKIDPNNQNASDNLEELEAYLGSKNDTESSSKEEPEQPADSSGETKKKSKKSRKVVNNAHHREPPAMLYSPDPQYMDENTMPLPRVHIDDFYKPENAKYHMGRTAFVLEGSMKGWRAPKKWTDEFMIGHWGDSMADYYPNNMETADAHPYIVPLRDAMRELYHPTSAYPHNEHIPGRYIQWNMNYDEWNAMRNDFTPLPYAFEVDDSWMTQCFKSDQVRSEFQKKTHWRMILIGCRGAGMFIHTDVLRSSSWHATIRGAKRWFVCAPSENRYIPGAGLVNGFLRSRNTTGLTADQIADADKQRLKYPDFDKARCWDATTTPGDVLFYPKNYWHQTQNLETPTMTLTSTIVDGNNFDAISHEFKQECQHQKYKWHFSDELCRGLDQCIDQWSEQYRDHTSDACQAD